MTELVSLFLAALLSATLLPGSSEAALAAVVGFGGAPALVAVAVATFGNTLGSCVNWGIGRFFAGYREHRRSPVRPEHFERAVSWYRRWGVWSLLLSWAPVVGDPLTVVAGVLRTPLPLFVLVVGVAKLLRYLAVAGLVALF
ncbi:YqaA family protein [Chelatococcus sp. SYSU_G07232]|uniref:YqaA family protein n=1 Tax=Chelatococcus albus TaxID=3047466 RepID=A0ABT7AIX3_9HYPH|nr:YqaA family protein [Chelatococcus sp. SYSU_G07232]MDJ1158947.1 YqaA family protein [Chelatococcus sp. SYSU_G07232]